MLLQKLNKYLILIFCFVSVNLLADTNWEVATIFLGKNEDSTFQNDIQAKISNLNNLKKDVNLKVSILNENKKTSEEDYKEFFKKSFASSTSKKLLLIYSHGEGANGLKDYSISELKNKILNYAPHMDILWFDACFMANIEFLNEIKNYSDYTIASEDAEFTSGLDLVNFELLPTFSKPELAATTIANHFINSYSYIKGGEYRENAIESSATISVIENKKLINLIQSLKEVKRINLAQTSKKQDEINNLLNDKYSMDNHDYVDLGNFLISLRSKNRNFIDDRFLTEQIRLLNIKSIKSTKSNPRIKIKSPLFLKETIMVYGYNNWTQGSETEFNDYNDILNSVLKPDGFVQGLNNQMWPYKKLKGFRGINITPFAPGLVEFNYYITDMNNQKIENTETNYKRSSDLYENNRINTNSPIVYSAYTQAIGRTAEKYTGLSITNPRTTPSIDYFESEFNQLVEWLNL